MEYDSVATPADDRFWVVLAKTKELYKGLHTVLSRRYLLRKLESIGPCLSCCCYLRSCTDVNVEYCVVDTR